MDSGTDIGNAGMGIRPCQTHIILILRTLGKMQNIDFSPKKFLLLSGEFSLQGAKIISFII